ncbi:MAG: FAD:protein FMN transferase [Candidatus Marinamargulisbacteria bacterium]|nr:FAD:protein FMN transferase [Candidatus Marinamargulisbacteria bacterium]
MGKTAAATRAMSLTRRYAMNRWRLGFILLFFVLVLYFWPRETVIQGQTMGTTYQIKYWSRRPYLKAGIARTSAAELDRLVQIFSTYHANTEIQKLNQSGGTHTLSPDMQVVLETALAIAKKTHGAYDITVEPLYALWGFKDHAIQVPSAVAIQRTRARVGYQQLKLVGNQLTKPEPVQLDVSSLAKGYAVDQLAELVADRVNNFMIEIGGEVVARGQSLRKQAWVVGIEDPHQPGRVKQPVSLYNEALATSGTYRNTTTIDGKNYAHVLDPRTGYPVQLGIDSVSVKAPTCMLADAWATALLLIKPDDAHALVPDTLRIYD